MNKPRYLFTLGVYLLFVGFVEKAPIPSLWDRLPIFLTGATLFVLAATRPTTNPAKGEKR